VKILIRLPNWLGDVVMSTAFISAVREIYPEAAIHVIIKKELGGIAALIPGLTQIHPFSKQEYPGLKGAYRFGSALKGGNYDLFFNLPESFSSQVMARATKAKKRIGFTGEAGRLLLTDSLLKPKNSHRVDEYLSLIEQYSGSKMETPGVKLETVQPNKAPAAKILVNFNSEASSRRMPFEKAISIVNSLLAGFKNVNLSFIGAPKEQAFVQQIIDAVAQPARTENLAGKTNLQGLAEMMAASTVLLTTDSGPAHLANSVGAPTIVLFGAGNEHNTAPYNKNNLTVIRYGKLDCEPCLSNTCKLYGIPKCMQLIDELQIIAAMRQFIV
jgi:lipopolysaccharide heptosyltransferase II